ncbi:PhzF family phenazine biosynthesis protein [Tumidithrix helvetica PCC 7403]|uniref:PhzF family phenazine biosynthesis protein n=1 Tax=Tumidithrix helvetica TaxID=3457545 RepID=UPI003CA56D87
MQFQVFVIDAFTHRVFQGNPAATILVDEFPSEEVMYKIAAEMNLSETAFVVKLSPNHFHLRWFTPAIEVNLCGHATLAMSHYLREIQAIDPQLPLTFQTLSGMLKVAFEDSLISMEFPAAHPVPCSARSLAILPEILGERSFQCLGQTDQYITVVLNSESDVAAFEPDLPSIAQLDGFGFIITALADTDRPYDFVSRFFAPKAGINEDPVTGSAHCTLAPYWSEQLGKSTLKAKQLSKRSGNLEVVNLGDRVLLKGEAVTVMQGYLTI